MPSGVHYLSISKLTKGQAMYPLLTRAIPWVTGTEQCRPLSHVLHSAWHAPFLPLPPMTYATQEKLLGERIAKRRTNIIPGEHRLDQRPLRVGSRMKLARTRAAIRAAWTVGTWAREGWTTMPLLFNVAVPKSPAPATAWRTKCWILTLGRQRGGLQSDLCQTI